MIDRQESASSRRPRFVFTTPLAVALLTLILASDTASPTLRPNPLLQPDRVAQGILVEPNAGDLEPPSIADENEQADDGDDSGESVPAVIAPKPGIIQVVPAVPESRQEELERPGARQREMERGDTRQEDLEMPGGPGVQY